MKILVLFGGLVVTCGVAAAPSPAASLADLVHAIQSADYRGARDDLRRLADALQAIHDPALMPYRHYWHGFALWRRAQNGFNETPAPADIEQDLKTATTSFQAALALKPEWLEARIGIVGCAGPLLFLAGADTARRDSVLETYRPTVKAMDAAGADNPRALWLHGQALLGAPPPYGGRPAEAADTFHRGVEAALAEALRLPASEPAWIPRWGAAENLMNLAYLYTHSSMADRELALAYAEGALVRAPQWHYVRDVLRPQILALSPAPRAARPAPGPSAP